LIGKAYEGDMSYDKLAKFVREHSFEKPSKKPSSAFTAKELNPNNIKNKDICGTIFQNRLIFLK